MRKFIVYTKALPGQVTDLPSVVEIECQFVSAIEDPSVMWLPDGERTVRVQQPVFLLEKDQRGKPVEPIYYQHAFFDSELTAFAAARQIVRHNFEFIQRKTGTVFIDSDVETKSAQIQIVRL